MVSYHLNRTDELSNVLSFVQTGIVKVVFVFVSFFMVDTHLGRRRTLMLGSLFMFVSFFVLAGLILTIQRENGGTISEGSTVGGKGIGAMVMIYFFAIGYLSQ